MQSHNISHYIMGKDVLLGDEKWEYASRIFMILTFVLLQTELFIIQ